MASLFVKPLGLIEVFPKEKNNNNLLYVGQKIKKQQLNYSVFGKNIFNKFYF